MFKIYFTFRIPIPNYCIFMKILSRVGPEIKQFWLWGKLSKVVATAKLFDFCRFWLLRWRK